MARVFCIDIGNTSAHLALVEDQQVYEIAHVATSATILSPECLSVVLARFKDLDGFSLCSVVPNATRSLLQWLKLYRREPVCHLHYEHCPGLRFDYPNPAEVGPDRLANAMGAQWRGAVPAVVVDLGTATTFDIVLSTGYAGGVIAPGLAVMTDYLHEKTALLPRLSRDDLEHPRAWGKSTVEAMKVGCGQGYRGLIKTLLKSVLQEIKDETGTDSISVITTGGNAGFFHEGWFPGAEHDPYISFRGLFEAFRRTYNLAD